MKRIIILLLLTLGVNLSSFSISRYVGQSIHCEIICAASVMDVSWRTTGGFFSFTGNSFCRDYTVTQYFLGTSTIIATYSYVLGGKEFNGRQEWEVSCTDNPIQCPPIIYLDVGETTRVVPYLKSDQSGSYGSISLYSNSDGKVIKVSDTGYITALSPGQSTILYQSKASADFGRCVVTVNGIDPKTVSLPETAKVFVGETTTLSPTLYPSNAYTELTWYSTDYRIASVSEGIVTGKKEGSTQIYCITDNGLTSNMCDVSVEYRSASNISFACENITLPIGQIQSLSYSVKPSNAKYSVSWNITDATSDDVISISKTGEITALQAGTAVVTVTTDNGVSARCTVTVPPNPTDIELYSHASMVYGEYRRLKYTVYPENAYCELTWSSSDPGIVKVDKVGNLSTVADGSAIITVLTQNGKTASCTVEVQDPLFALNVWTSDSSFSSFLLKEHPTIRYSDASFIIDTETMSVMMPVSTVRKFTLSRKETNDIPTGFELAKSLSLKYHTDYQLDYEMLPKNYDISTSIAWKSTNTDVVIVNSTGLLFAAAPGEADVVISANNGNSDTCHVLVAEPEFYLNVWLSDGTVQSVQLTDKPVVKYENELMVLESADINLSYPAGSIRKITMTDHYCPIKIV